MTYDRRAYDDADSTAAMTLDAAACSDRLPVGRPGRRVHPDDVVRPAPRLEYDAARETPKRDIEIGRAAAHLASRLQLR